MPNSPRCPCPGCVQGKKCYGQAADSGPGEAHVLDHLRHRVNRTPGGSITAVVPRLSVGTQYGSSRPGEEEQHDLQEPNQPHQGRPAGELCHPAPGPRARPVRGHRGGLVSGPADPRPRGRPRRPPQCDPPSQLDDFDIGNRRLVIDGRVRPLDELTLQLALAWLDYRRKRWPDTANPTLLINKHSALETGSISGVSVSAALRGQTATLERLRVDRQLEVAPVHGPDSLHLAEVSGQAEKSAIRYAGSARALLAQTAELST